MTRCLFLASFVLAGCGASGPLVRDAPGTDPPVGYPDHSVEQIVTAVAASVAPVLSVAADGRLTATTPEGTNEATFSLRTRLADSTAVTVRAATLGLEAGRALVTPDSVFLSNRLAREFVVGPASAADRLVPGLGVDGRAARAALGLLVPEAGVAWSLVAENGRYRLSGRVEGASRSYVVDPSVWRVVSVTEFDADGRERGRQSAEAFDTVDGVVLPRRVTLDGQGARIELEHRRLVVNPDDLRIRFRRPDDYEVIRL